MKYIIADQDVPAKPEVWLVERYEKFSSWSPGIKAARQFDTKQEAESVAKQYITLT